MRLLPFALLALTTLTAAASIGCRRSMAPICRQLCTCSPCTPDDFDLCVAKADVAQAHAESSDCAAPFDTLVSCLEDNVSCREGTGEGAGTDKCNRADRAMVLCDGSVNPFATPCEEAPIKAQACTSNVPTTPVKPTFPCNGFSLCIAECTLAQPCEVLNGTKSNQPLVDCNNACQTMIGPGSGGFEGGGPKHDKP